MTEEVGCPMQVGRRAFLRGVAAGAVGTAALGGGVTAAVAAGSSQTDGQAIPWDGAHQAGILTRQQSAATFLAFDSIAPDRTALAALFATLTNRIRVLTAGGPVAVTSVATPPSDSNTLGPILPTDGLTITVGVGANLFDGRYGLAERKPAHLVPMPVFPDDNVAGSTELHGDISLQICADSQDTVMHAVRDIAKHTRAAMQPRWKIDGFRAAPRPSGTPRNQLGFKDGIANPDIADSTVTDALVWARGGVDGELAWADGGSYQVVRIIRMLVEFWDRVSLHEQEKMIGRQRDSGAPLGGVAETELPDYGADRLGLTIPENAHIRLANPRTPDTDNQQILRRGYNYDRGLDLDGNLDVGLVFCCYQQNALRQFQAVQTRLAGEPLVDYISPTGGGYFFALPGVAHPDDHLGSGMFATEHS